MIQTLVVSVSSLAFWRERGRKEGSVHHSPILLKPPGPPFPPGVGKGPPYQGDEVGEGQLQVDRQHFAHPLCRPAGLVVVGKKAVEQLALLVALWGACARRGGDRMSPERAAPPCPRAKRCPLLTEGRPAEQKPQPEAPGQAAHHLHGQSEGGFAEGQSYFEIAPSWGEEAAPDILPPQASEAFASQALEHLLAHAWHPWQSSWGRRAMLGSPHPRGLASGSSAGSAPQAGFLPQAGLKGDSGPQPHRRWLRVTHTHPGPPAPQWRAQGHPGTD